MEFVCITEIDITGCELLLKEFRYLTQSQKELFVIGAHNLIKDVRSMVSVGRRDENEAPWLLLLTLLQLANDKPGFEETSIDYCITYEVSPPPFDMTPNNPDVELVDTIIEFEETDRFLLPPIINSNVDELITQIYTFAKEHHFAHLDCAQLQCIEFGACRQLLGGLITLSKQQPISIEFHHVNYLILVLLNSMGFKNIATLFPQKH